MSDIDLPIGVRSNIVIPSPPDIITALSKSMADLNTLGEMIAENEVLAAEVVNTINAPCFNLVRKIGSIGEAVRFLGQDRIIRLATARSLRTAFVTNSQSFLEEVWSVANRVAVASVFIAKELKLTEPDIAYELGLFHNVGMGLIYNQTTHYRNIVRGAYRHESGALEAYEKHHLDCTHAEISAEVAEKWQLEEISISVIRHHHSIHWINQQFKEDANEELLKLLAMLKLAEKIAHTSGFIASAPVNHEWEKVAPAIMEYLNLNDMKLERLKRKVLEGMKEEPN